MYKKIWIILNLFYFFLKNIFLFFFVRNWEKMLKFAL